MTFLSALPKQVYINGKVERVSKTGDNQSGDGVAEERKAHSDGEI
jgi:hypothetical protein